MKENKNIFILAGPIVFTILFLIGPHESLNKESFGLLLTVVWMAIWWITEAIPIGVTSLLPIVLFPILGIMDLSITAESYGNKIIFLFIGGFILALAVEKWNLHKRIALSIISIIGTNISNVMLGFMLATAFLSMWISNTATTVMMLPIALSVVAQFKTENEETAITFGKALMLSIAFSASIGGLGTLIGTPPNLIFASFIQENYGVEISFVQWMKIGIPISLSLLFIAWIYLTKFAFTFKNAKVSIKKNELSDQLKKLGPMTWEEKWVLLIFTATVFCWITRSFLLNLFIPKIDDTIIAICAAILLFILPSNEKNRKLMSWNDALKLPWGILLLFGGGLAIASGFKTTGLAVWVGNQLSIFEGISLILIVFLTIAMVNFLTEVTSNLATTSMLLPIMAPLALAINVDAYTLMICTTLAASCAFMLPVATPPNAVVFGSRLLKISEMAKVGFWMNVLSIVILTLLVYYYLPLIWN